jgi:hypothetical protein
MLVCGFGLLIWGSHEDLGLWCVKRGINVTGKVLDLCRHLGDVGKPWLITTHFLGRPTNLKGEQHENSVN